MTFEEYEREHLFALTECAKKLVRMGWNARGELGGDHVADTGKMVQAAVSLIGDITDEDGATFHRALLIQFTDDDSLRVAIQSGQCRFTVFGGEV